MYGAAPAYLLTTIHKHHLNIWFEGSFTLHEYLEAQCSTSNIQGISLLKDGLVELNKYCESQRVAFLYPNLSLMFTNKYLESHRLTFLMPGAYKDMK